MPDLCCHSCGADLALIQGARHRTYAGRSYCQACFDTEFSPCRNCGGSTPRNEFLTLPNGNRVCLACYDEYVAACDECGRETWRNECQSDDDGNIFCPRCFNEYPKQPAASFLHNASRRFVGFEVEYLTPESDPSALRLLGRFHDDGSIGGSDAGREFVSFPANGDKLLTVLSDVSAILQSHGAYVNATCGFHVHFDMSQSDSITRRNLRDWWVYLEPVFFAMVPHSRRGREWCKPTVPDDSYWDSDRYRALNITALQKHGTFEVRLHQGTLNPQRMTSWVRILLAFFDGLESVRLPETCDHSDSHREKLAAFFRHARVSLSVRKLMLARLKLYSPGVIAKPLRAA